MKTLNELVEKYSSEFSESDLDDLLAALMNVDLNNPSLFPEEYLNLKMNLIRCYLLMKEKEGRAKARMGAAKIEKDQVKLAELEEEKQDYLQSARESFFIMGLIDDLISISKRPL